MATEFINNTQEEEENGQQQITGAAAPSAGAPPAPGGGAPGSVFRPQKGSGRTTNLQKYIQANIGFNAPTGGLAGAIQERAGQRAGEIGKGVGEARQQFGQAAGQVEEQLGEQAEQTIQTAFKDPQQILQQQGQLQQFQQLRDQGLQQQIGGLGGTGALQRQAAGLQETAGLAGTEPGRFQLLRQAFGTPTYSGGQQRLDQLLLQASPGQARQLQRGLGETARGVSEQVGALGEEQTARRSALQEMAGQRSQQIANLLAGGTEAGIEEQLGQRGLGDIEQSLQQRLEERTAAGPQTLEEFQQRVATGQLTPEDLQQMGLSSEEQLYTLDLSQFARDQYADPTLAGISSPEEYARYQALSQLSGVDPTLFGGATEAQIGQYDPGMFDVGAFRQAQQDVSGRVAQHMTGFEDLLQQTKDIAASRAHRLDPSEWVGGDAQTVQGRKAAELIQSAQTPEEMRAALDYFKSTNLYSDPFLKDASKMQEFLRQYEAYQPGRTLQSQTAALESPDFFGVE